MDQGEPRSHGPISYGIVVWRRTGEASADVTSHDVAIEVLLGHMGGPYWARKDEGAWSIPKGLADDGEAPLDAARREFGEELGLPLPFGELVLLGEVRQSSKKRVRAWALELSAGDDLDLEAIVSNTFEAEWPPRSGRVEAFPEIDRAGWFTLDEARVKMVRGQTQLLDLLDAFARPRR